MDWQHGSDRYSVALYTKSDESEWQATAENSNITSIVIPIFYDYPLLPDFQTKIM